MDKKDIVKDAITEAIFLLNEEFESVINEELAGKYGTVLARLQTALNLLQEQI